MRTTFQKVGEPSRTRQRRPAPATAHMGAVRGSLFAQLTEEGKDMLIHDAHHLAGFEVLEARPAEVFVRLAFVIGAYREDPALHLDAEHLSLVFLVRL